MSFLTEYFDEYRQHPIHKRGPCLPEERWAKMEGIWLDPKRGSENKEMSDEEIQEFIKKTMRSLRGQSTYFNEYCAHLNQEFKTRPFKPRAKKCRSGLKDESNKEDDDEKEKLEQERIAALPQKLALKDTVVMKMAKDLFERDLDEPTLEPLRTHFRINGYVRPHLYHTGLSEYQGTISRLAYELVRDDRIPQYKAANGGRPKWGYPPEEVRQPELDGIPYDGERLYD